MTQRLTQTGAYVQNRWAHQLRQVQQEREAFFDDLVALSHHLLSALAVSHNPQPIRGVVIYGSNLREDADSLLDAYVIVDRYQDLNLPSWHGWLGQLLPPNVYQCAVTREDQTQFRVKYAVVTLSQFKRKNCSGFHSYFWARFAQPTLLLGADSTTTEQLGVACAGAAKHMAAQSLPLLPHRFSVNQLWSTGFAQTYASELRAESKNRSDQLVSANLNYYEELTAALVKDGLACTPSDSGSAIYSHGTSPNRTASQLTWRTRQIAGKCLSLLRLMKASLTFNDGVDYLLWKIARHTGIEVTATAKQRRYPLLFAWPLVWRLYRLGAFR